VKKRCKARKDCAAYIWRDGNYPFPWTYVCTLKQAPTTGITTGWTIGGGNTVLGTRILSNPTLPPEGDSSSNTNNQKLKILMLELLEEELCH